MSSTILFLYITIYDVLLRSCIYGGGTLKQLVRRKTKQEKKATYKDGFNRNLFRCRFLTKVQSFYLKALKGSDTR